MTVPNQLLILVICLLLFNTVFSQKEGNIWYFGESNGLNFNPQTPFIENNNAMETFEGCATICDASGEMLFYTNGGGRANGQAPGTIWNKNHQVLHNMQGLQGGGFSSRQSSIIVPKPNTMDQYYLFTMEELEALADGTPARGFSYFEIDMTQNGGTGGVTNYQESVELQTREHIGACLHANGTDYWVAIHNHITNAVQTYSVTNSGVNLVHTVPLTSSAIYGLIKFSPDKSKMFVLDVLFDFDNSTGQLSNPLSLPPTKDIYSTSFSPNSQYLYFVDASVQRVDVTATNVLASLETIGTWSSMFGAGTLQVAPDGNIYFLESNITFPGLSVIQCANSLTPCVENITTYPNAYGPFYGLPNFTDHIFANQAIGNTLPVEIQADAIGICPGQTVNLTVHVSPDYDILWSDGSTSPSIQVTSAGVYSVTINDGCCNVKSGNIDLICETTSIDQLHAENDINLFPNPTEGEIYIESSQAAGTIEAVEIFSIDGKYISKITDTHVQKIDLQSLNEGMYIVRLTTEKGSIVNRRILKN